MTSSVKEIEETYAYYSGDDFLRLSIRLQELAIKSESSFARVAEILRDPDECKFFNIDELMEFNELYQNLRMVQKYRLLRLAPDLITRGHLRADQLLGEFARRKLAQRHPDSSIE